MCTIQRIVQQMTDNKYKVIDNYLSHDDFNTLKDIIFNTEFPWFHNENIVTDDELLKNSNGIPFYYQVHLIYQDNKPNSTFYDSIMKYFDFALSLYRVKVNYYPNQGQFIEHSYHADFDFPHRGALFSLNTCDGYTLIGDDKVDSVENRMIFFDPTKPHASTNTTDQVRRVNINFNYF